MPPHIIGSTSASAQTQTPSASPPLSSPRSSSTSKLRLLILEPPPCSSSTQFFSANVAQQTSLVPPLLQALTGEAPPAQHAVHGSDDAIETTSFAGYTTHPPLRVVTRYFNTRVGVWCDEVPLPHQSSRPSTKKRGGLGIGDTDGDSGHRREDAWAAGSQDEEETEEAATTQTWLTQMLSLEPEAAEVRSVIGAILLAIPVGNALEASASQSLSSYQTTEEELAWDQDDQLDTPRRAGRTQWTLRRDYVDVIEAVNTLRSTIEDERAGQAHAGNEPASTGSDVGAVIVLQGPLPKSQNPIRRGGTGERTAPAVPDDHKAADEFVEAVQQQLFTDRGLYGWDVVAWDGVVSTIGDATATTAADPSGSGQPGEKEKEAHGHDVERRNIYDERTGLSRLRDVLHNVDWSALPSSPPHRHRQSNNDNENSGSDADADADGDIDLDFLSSSADDFKAKVLKMEHSNGDPEGDEGEAIKVEQLQGLLQQAMSIRERGAEMPRGERERYARKMVGRLVEDL